MVIVLPLVGVSCVVGRIALSIGYGKIPHTAISIKVVHEQSGNVKYERERLLGIAMKIH
jgi:hypothetical protein